jgi:hypothetical protein
MLNQQWPNSPFKELQLRDRPLLVLFSGQAAAKPQ